MESEAKATNDYYLRMTSVVLLIVYEITASIEQQVWHRAALVLHRIDLKQLNGMTIFWNYFFSMETIKNKEVKS